MNVVVSLRDLVGESQALPSEATAYLNRATGKVFTVIEEAAALLELDSELGEGIEVGDDDPGGEGSDSELGYFQEVKRALASDPGYLELPSKFEIYDCRIMERFCLFFPDPEISDVLLQKIRGSGAFRRFKDAIDRYDIVDDWYKYQGEAYKEIAID